MRRPAAPSAPRILNGAVSQLDRVRHAPAPERVEVDGRTLAQLLAFGARYGALIEFYDLDNIPHGDWSAFFVTDPTVASALHASLDFPEIEEALRQLLAAIRAAEDGAERGVLLFRIVRVVVRLLCILDRAPYQGADAGSQLAQFARTDRRDGLAPSLKRLHHHLSGKPLTHWIGEDGSRHDHGWLHAFLAILDDVVECLIDALRHGAAAALTTIEASLGALGHAPQSALYNAFTVLFHEARRELNRFPRRLLTFYYADILKQDSRAAEPDRVFLTFTLAQGSDQAAIPKGTLFSAGTASDGAAINYAADVSLEVESVVVSALNIHRVTFANGGPIPTATGVISGTVQGTSDGVLPAAPFPLFGSDHAGTTGSLTMLPANIGFAVASPTLLLRGGSRSVSVSLTPSVTTGAAPEDAESEDVGPGGVGPSGAGPGGVGSARLAGVVQTSFLLYYSTAGGWMAVDSFTATATGEGATGEDGETVVIAFDLPASAPPLVPLSTVPAANAPAPTLPATAFPTPGDQPTLLAKLQPAPAATGVAATDLFSSFQILSQVAVTSVTVDVTVTDLPPDSLASSSGAIDASQNFAVFGLPPTQNATLTIVAAELFVKPLTSLSVTLNWAGLPVTSTGFQGYYKGYVLDADGVPATQPLFDNTTFKATLDVAAPGFWSLPAPPPLYLFQTTGSSTASTGPAPAAGAPVLPASVLAAAGVTPAATPPAYYNPSSNALLLTLAEPGYAFGNVLYSSNLTYASNANIAALQANTRAAGTTTASAATTQIANAATVNAKTDDKSYTQSVGAAVEKAVSALNGTALAALLQAVAGAAADTQSTLLQSLQAAVAGGNGQKKTGPLRSRLSGNGKPADAGSVTAQLKAWRAAHQGELAGSAGAVLQQADAALSAAGSLTATATTTSGQTVASARPTLAAALQQAQATLGAPTAGTAPAAGSLPNAPWLPMASSVTVTYQATGTTQLASFSQEQADAAGSTASGGGTSASAATGPTGPDTTGVLATGVLASQSPLGPPTASDHQFWHLGLFDQILPASAGSVTTVTMLPHIAHKASLYIDLSAPVEQISLLFILQASPDGWSTETPRLSWEQQIGWRWKSVKLLSDTTNGLLNTGIVTLQLDRDPDPDATPRLRVLLVDGMTHIPYVKSVTTNALTATWVGPGGASRLGSPLPAGTITQSRTPIDGVGTISQPEDSVGGFALATGPDFDLWMAERLRHKGFAIDAWDYARLVLASVPSLWQLAVIPATDAATGREAPGHIWIVAVAGPQTPNVSDPTEPLVDPAVLAEIGERLEPVASPFVTIAVTNPPYLRLTVEAELVFTDTDTAVAWEEKLQGELIKWLSPWPDPALGPRPAEYYSRQAVADFISRRSYVRAVLSLEIEPERDLATAGCCYLTSATKHRLRGWDASDSTLAGARPTRALAPALAPAPASRPVGDRRR